MRRLYRLLLGLFLILFVLLVLYAFVDPVRGWMQVTLGPPASDIFSGFVKMIAESWLWQNYVIPFPNQLILGAIILGFPIAWLWHKNFNWVRSKAVHSAAKDSGMYPTMTEPIGTSSVRVQEPTPISTAKTETAPTPEPAPKPAPVVETKKTGAET